MGHDKNNTASRPISNTLTFFVKTKFFTNWLGQNVVESSIFDST